MPTFDSEAAERAGWTKAQIRAAIVAGPESEQPKRSFARDVLSTAARAAMPGPMGGMTNTRDAAHTIAGITRFAGPMKRSISSA